MKTLALHMYAYEITIDHQHKEKMPKLNLAENNFYKCIDFMKMVKLHMNNEFRW